MEFGAPLNETMVNIVKEDDHDRDPAGVDRYYHDLANLPPGFRFHPTDEEIVTHYLTPKVINPGFTASAIGQVDLNKSEPWDLPQKAKMGEKEWFFFCQRDRKYPTGMRTNRATESGYWKATGKDKDIYDKHRGGSLIGMKKTLVFYKGRAPKGEKTNWVMHEFRLEGKFSYYNFSNATKDEWVVCRVVHKNSTIYMNNKRSLINDYKEVKIANSFVDGLLDSPSLPPLTAADFDDKSAAQSSFTINNINCDTCENEEIMNKGKFVREITDRNGLINDRHNAFQMPVHNYNFYSNTYDYQGGMVNRNQYPSSFRIGASSGGNDQSTHDVEEFIGRFKVKQSISHSIDTGLSTAYDMNTEISSSSMAVLKTEITSDPLLLQAHSLSDFDSFWEY